MTKKSDEESDYEKLAHYLIHGGKETVEPEPPEEANGKSHIMAGPDAKRVLVQLGVVKSLLSTARRDLYAAVQVLEDLVPDWTLQEVELVGALKETDTAVRVGGGTSGTGLR